MRIFSPHFCYDVGMILTTVLAILALVVGSWVFWPVAALWVWGWNSEPGVITGD